MNYTQRPPKPCPPNNPHCQPPLPIDDFIPMLLFMAIVFGIYKLTKNK